MAKPFLVLTAATGLLIATLPTAGSAAAGTAPAEQGFELITGDGHLLLADCPSTPGNDGFIRVRRNLEPIACFKVPAGQSDRLTMESTVIDISKNKWTPIPGDKGSTLVTLVAAP